MSASARVIFIMSTGRCSTQFLARLLESGTPKAMVVHEGAGPNYKPAQVFRTNEFAPVVETTHQLRNQFDIIEQQLEKDSTFIDTGWPAYAWGPYLEKRFGAAFRFAHLVRNPFSFAASMSTHLLLDDREETISKFGIIRPHLPGVKYPEFFNEYSEFTRFERGLYHWLEVNSYLLEQHDASGFMGLFRFEEMYGEAQKGARALWQKCGFQPAGFEVFPAYDRFNRNTGRFSPPNEALFSYVWDLALRLGYDQALLQKWSDLEVLSNYYSRRRIARLA